MLGEWFSTRNAQDVYDSSDLSQWKWYSSRQNTILWDQAALRSQKASSAIKNSGPYHPQKDSEMYGPHIALSVSCSLLYVFLQVL